MKINERILLILIFILLTIFPYILSIFFKLIELNIASYLISILIAILAIIFFWNNTLVLKVTYSKVAFWSFIIWIIFSSTYSISTVESKNKLLNILYLIVVPSLILEVYSMYYKLCYNDIIITLNKKLYSNAIGFTWLFFILFIFFKMNVGERWVLPGVENPIWLTRIVGLLLLILIIIPKRKTLLNLLTILLALYLLAAFGSRTPMLAMVFCLCLYFFRRYNLKILLKYLLIIAVLGFIGFVFIQDSYLFETNFYSLYARLDLLKTFEGLNMNFKTGMGLGSFGLFLFNEDVQAYPHNCFAEIFIETGMIGLGLFIVLLICFFKAFKCDILSILCLYFFINSLASGDIPGNNLFFILLYLVLILAYKPSSILQLKAHYLAR